MTKRSGRIELALRDFEAARRSLAEGRFALACLAAQQAALDALGALLEESGISAEGRTLEEVLKALGDKYDVSPIARAALELDSYSAEWAEDSPSNRVAAARALAKAEQLIVWVLGRLGPSHGREAHGAPEHRIGQ